MYIVLAVMLAFILPFAFFFYENDMDDEAETDGFFDTQTGSAIKHTVIVAFVFCITLALMYVYLHNANVPVTRYLQTIAEKYQVQVLGTATNTAASCLDATVNDGTVSTRPGDT